MKKTKILFTINNLGTAGMRFVLADIAMTLPKDRFKVAIAVNYLTESALELQLQNHFEIIVVGLRTNRRPKLLYPFRLLKNALRLKGKHDIAHSFDYASDASEGLIMKLAGIKWVAEKTNLIYKPDNWDRKLKLATKIICLSNAQKIQIDKFAAKTIIIPTGIDEKRFENAAAANRKEFSLSDNHIICIVVAHLIDVKGHLETMEAMIELKEEFPELVMLFVGKGEPEYEEFLKDYAKKNNLNDCVQFLGERSDIPELIKMSDFKLLPTRNTGRREGFGAVVVEAMACKKAVVSTKCGGPEDIVIHNKIGLLVDAEGAKPLVDGLRYIMINKDLLPQMGMKGYERYKENYTKTLMVDRYKQVYESISE